MRRLLKAVRLFGVWLFSRSRKRAFSVAFLSLRLSSSAASAVGRLNGGGRPASFNGATSCNTFHTDRCRWQQARSPVIFGPPPSDTSSFMLQVHKEALFILPFLCRIPLKSFRGFRPRHKVFSMAFSSIEKHCSYIFLIFGFAALRQVPGGTYAGNSPPFLG